MALLKDGAFTQDQWRKLGDDEDIPPGGQVILSLERWQKLKGAQLGANVPLGIFLKADTVVETLAEDLARFALIAIEFPKYTDGRGYSIAQKARGYFGFRGELRAVGDVLFDQLQAMERCGFDTFEITDAATLKLLESGKKPGVKNFYQPGLGAEVPAGTRPWLRTRTS
jgi:phosphoadenosine phosphosulfate reductase